MPKKTTPDALYQGRRWDAPIADNVIEADLSGRRCSWCDQLIGEDDDAMVLGGTGHTECIIRSALGDVPHLERQCLCYGGDQLDMEGTYRDQSQRAVDWLIAHDRGRWRE